MDAVDARRVALVHCLSADRPNFLESIRSVRAAMAHWYGSALR
jgi:hypothetical protein